MDEEMKAAGYIVQDKEGYAISADGLTAEAVRAETIGTCGPWEDRDGNTVGPADPDFGFDAKFIVYPATAALLAKVEKEGGAIAWDVVDGIACTREESEAAE
jgi:hypothetical protein